MFALLFLAIVILLALYEAFDPQLDYVIVGGKKKRILWYNTTNGRDWVFLSWK